MIESPWLRELIAENIRKTRRESILIVLEARFGREAPALRPMLKAIEDDMTLKRLIPHSGRCRDFESFKKLFQP
jgi:hypothetical protein